MHPWQSGLPQISERRYLTGCGLAVRSSGKRSGNVSGRAAGNSRWGHPSLPWFRWDADKVHRERGQLFFSIFRQGGFIGSAGQKTAGSFKRFLNHGSLRQRGLDPVEDVALENLPAGV